MDHLIEYAVNTIRERYFEPLTLDELASAAMVSKFHFVRVFRRVTGVTPGRFLSAVRLQEAKSLLLATTLNVSDISAQVGYSSTGSFSQRVSASVGCSPTQYRQCHRGEAEWPSAECSTTGAHPGTVGPISISSDTALQQNLTLRPLGWSHPPVLLALPEL